MQIATWNVNSARARAGTRITAVFSSAPRSTSWRCRKSSASPSNSPYAAFEAIGYKVIAHGLNQWNGVAFAYKQDLEAEDIETSFDQQPEFKDVQEARALGATFNGVRVWSLYVPNGRGLDDPHMQYKLEFLDRWLPQPQSSWKWIRRLRNRPGWGFQRCPLGFTMFTT